MNVLFVFEVVGKEDILTQVLKLSEENCSEPEQVVSDVLVVAEVVSIASEKVTEMLSVNEILLLLSVVEEIEETVGAVVSAVLVVLSVVVGFSSFSPQEMTVKLKRKKERIMSICLIGFLIDWFRRTQYITSIGLF